MIFSSSGYPICPRTNKATNSSDLVSFPDIHQVEPFLTGNILLKSGWQAAIRRIAPGQVHRGNNILCFLLNLLNIITRIGSSSLPYHR